MNGVIQEFPATEFTPAYKLIDEKTPSIAVVIPTFNSARYLAEAILSIKPQIGYGDVWILDGDSEDGTFLLCEGQGLGGREFIIEEVHPCDRIDHWIRDHGDEYDYLAIQHSDDIACPDRIANQLKAFELEPELACVSGAFLPFWHDISTMKFHQDPVERPPCLHDEICAHLPNHWVMHAPTRMFDIRKLMASGVKFRNRYDYANDWWMSVEMVRAGLRLGNCPQILQAYRRHGDSDGPRNLAAVNAEQADIRARIAREGIFP